MRPGGPAQDGEEEDALDAFMAAEILPEVTAAQQAERAAKEQERLERAKALAVRAAPLDKQARMRHERPWTSTDACVVLLFACVQECARLLLTNTGVPTVFAALL